MIQCFNLYSVMPQAICSLINVLKSVGSRRYLSTSLQSSIINWPVSTDLLVIPISTTLILKQF